MAKTSRKTATPTVTLKASAPRSTFTARTNTRLLPTEDQIRARAFQIYMNRNGGPGDAAGDWALAERQLIEELNR